MGLSVSLRYLHSYPVLPHRDAEHWITTVLLHPLTLRKLDVGDLAMGWWDRSYLVSVEPNPEAAGFCGQTRCIFRTSC